MNDEQTPASHSNEAPLLRELYAVSVVEALVQGGIIKREDFAKALRIATSELLVRQPAEVR
jgi:hypothetical protein